MALTPSTRIRNYEILAPLGAGGMGEVYRARDTRLDRLVAIKALPQGFALDVERVARFVREAKLLATLNHANIAAIYGLEDVDGAPYLVLEFVGGETLAQRLARGPLSVREALDVAIQIGAAVEAAHERGIVHRDLKPGNVMLTPLGTVKVLDFGLAREDAAASTAPRDLSAMATVGLDRTQQGVILGTVPYLSPEQARARGVDRRTDVWAFGCVLFECLTGRRAFTGGTSSDVIAHILERDPDWSVLPGAAPARLRELVRRCLIKDLERRPRDIGDLRRELSTIAAGGSSDTGTSAPATSAPPSLAVLYFENLANDPEGDYFCAGVTEDILTDLSRLTGMRVASRNTVARYRGTPVDIPQVAADLGVSAVLQGSVRRAGERVRITVQLVNARDGFQLWADRYDRTLRDVFAVQEEIASSIAAALSVALTPAESEALVRDRPHDARAYDLYLKGRARYVGFTPEFMREALQLFRQATAIDPDYALAWAGIADCYGQLLQWDAKETDELTRLGLEAARRAIEINPRLAEAHKAQALVLKMTGDRAGSHAALVRAIEVNPRHVPALVNLSVLAFSDSDLAGAERLVRRALEIEPQPFAAVLFAERLWATGRDDEALAAIDHLRRLTSEPIFVTVAWVLRTWVHLTAHDSMAADRAIRAGYEEGAEPLNLRAMEALLAATQERREEATSRLSELEAAPRLHALAPTMIAISAAYLRLEDLESALRWATKPLVRHVMPTFARLVPELHPLLDHPPLAPRRREITLVWPLEAPTIDATRHALFRDVRIESGIPQGSDLLGRDAG